jgi:26S proteasome regulatory subunit T5
VIKTSTRQTIFLPIPGLVEVEELKPGDLVGTNKDSYLILEKLPAEYDSRVKAMEVRACVCVCVGVGVGVGLCAWG